METEPIEMQADKPVYGVAISIKLGEWLRTNNMVMDIDHNAVSIIAAAGMPLGDPNQTPIIFDRADRGSPQGRYVSAIRRQSKNAPPERPAIRLYLPHKRKQLEKYDAVKWLRHESKHAGDYDARGHVRASLQNGAYTVALGYVPCIGLDLWADGNDMLYALHDGSLISKGILGLGVISLAIACYGGGQMGYWINPFEIRARRHAKKAAPPITRQLFSFKPLNRLPQ